jgi:hypothetical protein
MVKNVVKIARRQREQQGPGLVTWGLWVAPTGFEPALPP